MEQMENGMEEWKGQGKPSARRQPGLINKGARPPAATPRQAAPGADSW